MGCSSGKTLSFQKKACAPKKKLLTTGKRCASLETPILFEDLLGFFYLAGEGREMWDLEIMHASIHELKLRSR